MGATMFGAQNAAFQTVFFSGQTIFFFLLGENGAALETIVEDSMAGELGRILFFYSYLIFMYFLMLNMLLAIIVDSYEHMKENIGDHVPTVWSDLADLARQMYNVRKSKNRKTQTGDAYLSHEQVVHHFDKMLNTDAVNRDIQSHLQREQDGTVLVFFFLCMVSNLYMRAMH